MEKEKAKAQRWQQKELQRQKLFQHRKNQQRNSSMRQRVVIEEDSSDTSSSEVSSSSSESSVASSFIDSVSTVAKNLPKVAEEGRDPTVPASIVLKSGDEIKTGGLSYSDFKHLEILVAKADKAYLEKRRFEVTHIELV